MCDSNKKLAFGDIQRVLLMTRMVDGEVFIYKRYTDEGLKLQIMEADALDGGRDNGVEKDANGVITGYRFKVANSDGGYSSKTVTIPAEHIINYHKTERFSQDRGISEYKQAIIDIKNFSAYQSSTIQGARARASIAYTVQADANPANMGVTTQEDEQLQEINGVMVYYLKKGESISKTAPEGASEDYKAFTETTVRLMATARRISYELAFRDYSKVNFASSRASLIQDNYRFDAEQEHFVTYVLSDIFVTWMEIEIMRGNLKIPLARFLKDKSEYVKPRWIYPKRSFVDPLKDALALEKQIALNLTTQTDQAVAQGQDFEEIIAKKAEEIEILKKYGMYVEPEIEDKSSDAQSPTQEIAEARSLIYDLQERLEMLEEKK
jgi:lambda family phage portal protein